jgi:hypothetical protein
MSNSSKVRLVMFATIFLSGFSSVTFAGNFYEGKYKEWADKLLSAVVGWDCPYNAPRVKAGGCPLDQQVAAAVKSAWMAECLARDGETDKANAAAEEMYNNLKQAAGMCNKNSVSQLSEGDKACETEYLFDCAAFQQQLY